jgi:biopolymer transport protein TolQ
MTSLRRAANLFIQNQIVDSSFYHLVEQASVPAKLVLLVLLFSSIASWTIIFTKRRTLAQAVRQSQNFLNVFRRSRRWSDTYAVCDQYGASPLVALYLAAYNQMAERLSDGEEQQEQEAADQQLLLSVERALRRAAIGEIERMETSLPWLASIATSAPFIGLFGTVVGIIISFQGLSLQTQTSIQAVAPGIAEALIATAAGLFVAVPAYIAYNHFVAQLRRITGLIDDFGLEVLNAIERSIRHYGVLRS